MLPGAARGLPSHASVGGGALVAPVAALHSEDRPDLRFQCPPRIGEAQGPGSDIATGPRQVEGRGRDLLLEMFPAVAQF